MQTNGSFRQIGILRLLMLPLLIPLLLGEEAAFSQDYSSWVGADPTDKDSSLRPVTRHYGGWRASPDDQGAAASDPFVPDESTEDPQGLRQGGAAVQHASYFQSQENGVFPPPPVYPSPPVYPPTPANSSQSNRAVSTETGEVPSGLRRRNDESQQSQQTGGQGRSGVQNATQFETGLPFVTPSPQAHSNPGRYPTSPYMGPRWAIPYQNVSYQQISQAAIPGSVANTATLPQYQTASYQNPVFSNNPNPGIYPTSYQQCQVLPPPSLPPDGLSGQTYVPPTMTPNWNPNLYSSNNVGLRPLFSLGQENYNVVLGRGIIGQPKAYVQGQVVRNFLRYLTP